jgi:hypothetical protein
MNTRNGKVTLFIFFTTFCFQVLPMDNNYNNTDDNGFFLVEPGMPTMDENTAYNQKKEKEPGSSQSDEITPQKSIPEKKEKQSSNSIKTPQKSLLHEEANTVIQKKNDLVDVTLENTKDETKENNDDNDKKKIKKIKKQQKMIVAFKKLAEQEEIKMRKKQLNQKSTYPLMDCMNCSCNEPD